MYVCMPEITKVLSVIASTRDQSYNIGTLIAYTPSPHSSHIPPHSRTRNLGCRWCREEVMVWVARRPSKYLGICRCAVRITVYHPPYAFVVESSIPCGFSTHRISSPRACEHDIVDPTTWACLVFAVLVVIGQHVADNNLPC